MDDNYFFEECLRLFDSKMQGRIFLLILHNYLAQIKSENMPSLHKIEIFYLSPNTMSKLQTCDTGIIRFSKANHRHSFHQTLLQNVEDGIVDPKKLICFKQSKCALKPGHIQKPLPFKIAFSTAPF